MYFNNCLEMSWNGSEIGFICGTLIPGAENPKLKKYFEFLTQADIVWKWFWNFLFLRQIPPIIFLDLFC